MNLHNKIKRTLEYNLDYIVQLYVQGVPIDKAIFFVTELPRREQSYDDNLNRIANRIQNAVNNNELVAIKSELIELDKSLSSTYLAKDVNSLERYTLGDDGIERLISLIECSQIIRGYE